MSIIQADIPHTGLQRDEKPSILYILTRYPQTSQTYIKNEIEALMTDYNISIITLEPAESPYENHLPFVEIRETEKMQAVIDQVKPQIIHTHFVHMARRVGPLARKNKIPFTVRTHSFDILNLSKPSLWQSIQGHLIQRWNVKDIRWLNDDLCLGILVFPGLRQHLMRQGVNPKKLIDCYPVINYGAFYNREPNGDAIMNMGAVIRKKKMEDFIELAQMFPGRVFNLYDIECVQPEYHKELKRMNAETQHPVNFIPAVAPEVMPAEYKKHQWLVYTACPKTSTVGWSMAVAEAQASGVGVCFPNIRPDLKEYIGGAGYLYDSLDEVRRIISQPVPEDIREKGFIQAKKSDIQGHKHLLTNLWDKVIQAASTYR